MPDYRLKIKIGDHEFDAEGPADVVQAQFEVFKELVLTAPASKPADHKPTERQPEENGNGGGGNGDTPLELDKIMRSDGRLVSLTVRAESVDDGVLLIMLGQRQYR